MTKPVFSIPKCKFIDDMTLANSLDLKEKLVLTQNQPKPLNYHQRTNHVLLPEDNVMQKEINALQNMQTKKK